MSNTTLFSFDVPFSKLKFMLPKFTIYDFLNLWFLPTEISADALIEPHTGLYLCLPHVFWYACKHTFSAHTCTMTDRKRNNTNDALWFLLQHQNHLKSQLLAVMVDGKLCLNFYISSQHSATVINAFVTFILDAFALHYSSAGNC